MKGIREVRFHRCDNNANAGYPIFQSKINYMRKLSYEIIFLFF